VSGPELVAVVAECVQAHYEQYRYGPFHVSLGSAYEDVLYEPYSPATYRDTTLYDRLLQLAGVCNVRIEHDMAEDLVLVKANG
jgi:hypothetical protein